MGWCRPHRQLIKVVLPPQYLQKRRTETSFKQSANKGFKDQISRPRNAQKACNSDGRKSRISFRYKIREPYNQWLTPPTKLRKFGGHPLLRH